MPGSEGMTLISRRWLFFLFLVIIDEMLKLSYSTIVCYTVTLSPPDGPNVQPDEVGGGEGVEGGRDPHQVRLLVPDPVE